MNEIICFHNPDEKNGYLSNWYRSNSILDHTTFTSMEQYMMYQKARFFKDQDIADQILAIEDVARIKELGRMVANYDEKIWNGVRQIIVYEGLLAKFSQNEELFEQLLSTGNAILAECAVRDQIWGIGLSMTDRNRFDMTKWRGQNLLGFARMMVRKQLKK